jgi:hypothetical protein
MARKSAADANLNRSDEPRSLLWLQGLLCGGLATLATPTALLLVVLFGPALLATLLDRQLGRPTARCIALCGMSAVVSPMRMLWAAGQTMQTAIALASDTETIARAWGAAGGGWLLAELMPIGVRALLETISRKHVASLIRTRDRLEAEWGPPPTE